MLQWGLWRPQTLGSELFSAHPPRELSGHVGVLFLLLLIKNLLYFAALSRQIDRSLSCLNLSSCYFSVAPLNHLKQLGQGW